MNPTGVTLLKIRKVVCDFYGITPEEICSRTRLNRIVWPRHVGLHFARKMTGLSLNEIASVFNIRQHGSVIHALKNVTNAMECYPSVRRDMDKIENHINERMYD